MGEEAAGDYVEAEHLSSTAKRPGELAYGPRRRDHHDEHPACAWKVARSWKSLRAKDRPKKAADLLRIMKDIYQSPTPAFMTSEIARRVDRAFDAFAKATEDLVAAMPSSEHYEALPTLMESRLPTTQRHAAESYVDLIASFIATIPAAPVLKPRILNSVSTDKERAIATSRGRKGHHQEVRLVVSAVCWYIVHIEREALRIGFTDEGPSKSRIARLATATLIGLGLTSERDLDAVEGELRRAKKIRWDSINFWELIPVYVSRRQEG